MARISSEIVGDVKVKDTDQQIEHAAKDVDAMIAAECPVWEG